MPLPAERVVWTVVERLNLHAGFPYGVEVGVVHGLLGRETRLVIVAQQLVQEVDGLRHRQVLVLVRDKLLPRFPRMPVVCVCVLSTGEVKRSGSTGYKRAPYLPIIDWKWGSSTMVYLSK